MPSIVARRRAITVVDEVEVAVAVIVDAERGVLLTRRHRDAHQGDLWEFPGGKREPSESISEALDRELREELGIGVVGAKPLIELHHDYGDKRVCLCVHLVTQFSGEPRPREGQPMRWVPRTELLIYEFPAANAPIVKLLVENADVTQ